MAVTIAPAVNDLVRNVEGQTPGPQLKKIALVHQADPDPVPLPMPVEPPPPTHSTTKGDVHGSFTGGAIVAPAGGTMMTAEQRTDRDIRVLIRKLD
jgi:hypothetical protein